MTTDPVLLKSQRVQRGLRQLREEYLAEGRPNVANNLTQLRILLDASPECAARIYDVLTQGDRT